MTIDNKTSSMLCLGTLHTHARTHAHPHTHTNTRYKRGIIDHFVIYICTFKMTFEQDILCNLLIRYIRHYLVDTIKITFVYVISKWNQQQVHMVYSGTISQYFK